MGWDCNKCKNKKSCEESSRKGELTKCKFEPLNEEKVDKFCEDFIKAMMEWRKPNKTRTLVELVELFDEYVGVE